MDDPALQNLDFLRQLISEIRDMPQDDAERLRMLYGTGLGTSNLTTQQGDRE
jgi:hypothetical protein